MAIYDDSVLCPCGSGRKLAECCWVIMPDSSAKTRRFSNMAKALGEEINRRLVGKKFSGDKEIQGSLQGLVSILDFCREGAIEFGLQVPEIIIMNLTKPYRS